MFKNPLDPCLKEKDYWSFREHYLHVLKGHLWCLLPKCKLMLHKLDFCPLLGSWAKMIRRWERQGRHQLVIRGPACNCFKWPLRNGWFPALLHHHLASLQKHCKLLVKQDMSEEEGKDYFQTRVAKDCRLPSQRVKQWQLCEDVSSAGHLCFVLQLLDYENEYIAGDL